MTELLTQRYQLQETIGKGGMGIVYRAVDRLTGEKVAFKRVLMPHSTDPERSTSQDTLDYRLALADEFRTLASLRHPHVIAVLDYGFDGERKPFYTMELIDEAETIVAYAQSQDENGKVRLWVQMLQALAYLHRQNIIHRDLKPANVLVKDTGEVKVLDFGLATHRQNAPTIAMGGTLAYMSPELLLENPPSVESDLYAAGILACELFMGKNPVYSPEMMTLVANILHHPIDLSPLPAPLQPIIQQLLEKDPQARYPSAEAVLNDLYTQTPYAIATESQAIRESFLRASAFVGRKAELSQVMVAFYDILSPVLPKSSLWLIAGESGVGKSRLVDEVRIRAMTQGALVLRGQASKEANALYPLWRVPIRRLLLENPPIAPETATLLDEMLQQTPNDAKRAEYANAILALFSAITVPTLLILEDVHWAEAEIPLLNRLMNSLTDKPVLVIATYRDDELPYLPEDLPNAEHLKLNRLDKTAIQQLTTSMLGKPGEDPMIIDFLHRETEGNAYFIVEVVRVLAEDAGSLADIGTRTLPEKVFAGGIRTVVKRRLERVPVDYRPLLDLAAVAGRWIDLPLLQHLAPEGIDVAFWLIECINAAILDIHDNRWRFAHEKLREALLDELSPIALITAHQRIAHALETLYTDDPNYIVALAYHFGRAELWERAAHYTIRAGDALNAISRYTQTVALCDAVLPHVQERDKRIRLLAVYATALYRMSKFRQLQPFGKEALELINEDEAYQSIAGMLMVYFGWGLHHLGVYDQAHFHFDRAYQIYQTLQDKQGLIWALHGRSTIAFTFADIALGESLNDRALALSLEIGDKQGEADSYNNKAVMAFMQDDFANFLAYSQKALALFDELGELRGMAMVQNNIGMSYAIQKDLDNAISTYRQSIAISQQIDDDRMTYNTQINLAFALLDKHPQDTEARQLFYRVIQNTVIRATSQIHLEALSGLAYCLYHEADYAKSAQTLGALLDDDHIVPELITYRIHPLMALLKDHLDAVDLATQLEAGESRTTAGMTQDLLAHFALYG